MVDFVATYTSPTFKAAGELLPSLAMHGRNIDASLLQQQSSPQQNARRFPKVATRVMSYHRPMPRNDIKYA
jgi:hypothetical protein